MGENNNQHVVFQILFLFLRCIDICTHKLTNIHATLPRRICANFHANTHTDTLFPSLTPNNSVVTSQIYSITATNPLTPPFSFSIFPFFYLATNKRAFSLHPRTFLGSFQSGASRYIKKIFYLSFVLECQTRITNVPASLFNEVHGEWYTTLI